MSINLNPTLENVEANSRNKQLLSTICGLRGLENIIEDYKRINIIFVPTDDEQLIRFNLKVYKSLYDLGLFFNTHEVNGVFNEDDDKRFIIYQPTIARLEPHPVNSHFTPEKSEQILFNMRYKLQRPKLFLETIQKEDYNVCYSKYYPLLYQLKQRLITMKNQSPVIPFNNQKLTPVLIDPHDYMSMNQINLQDEENTELIKKLLSEF